MQLTYSYKLQKKIKYHRIIYIRLTTPSRSRVARRRRRNTVNTDDERTTAAAAAPRKTRLLQFTEADNITRRKEGDRAKCRRSFNER